MSRSSLCVGVLFSLALAAVGACTEANTPGHEIDAETILVQGVEGDAFARRAGSEAAVRKGQKLSAEHEVRTAEGATLFLHVGKNGRLAQVRSEDWRKIGEMAVMGAAPTEASIEEQVADLVEAGAIDPEAASRVAAWHARASGATAVGPAMSDDEVEAKAEVARPPSAASETAPSRALNDAPVEQAPAKGPAPGAGAKAAGDHERGRAPAKPLRQPRGSGLPPSRAVKPEKAEALPKAERAPRVSAEVLPTRGATKARAKAAEKDRALPKLSEAELSELRGALAKCPDDAGWMGVVEVRRRGVVGVDKAKPPKCIREALAGWRVSLPQGSRVRIRTGKP